MSRTLAQPTSRVGRWWSKWRFHLNILLLLIPLGFMPQYFKDVAFFRGETGLGEHMIDDIKVGPWSLTLAEVHDEAPELDGPAGYMKSFNAAVCQACASQIKAAYLHLGKPRSLRAAGSIFVGNPYRMNAEVPVAVSTQTDAELWITVEGWDGSVHQATVPLTKASPKTVEWLAKNGGKP